MTENQNAKILQIQNLTSSIKRENKIISIVDNCSFDTHAGRTLGVMGESGSGKSFLALSLMRLLPKTASITSGKILLDNEDITHISEEEMQKIRGQKMAMIFQESATSLNPAYTIGHQIAEVFLLHTSMSKREARQRAIEMLEKVRIHSPEKRVDEYPHQISGGMRQRVMIAIAFACKPKFLIADEPTTALDVTIQAQILSLMNQLQEEHKMGMMFITHDLGVIAETCDDVAVMYAGKIVEIASSKEIFLNPRHPYTRALIASSPRIGERKTRQHSIPGMVPALTNLPKGCRFQDRCSEATAICKEREPVLETCGSSMVACFKARHC